MKIGVIKYNNTSPVLLKAFVNSSTCRFIVYFGNSSFQRKTEKRVRKEKQLIKLS